MRVFGGLVTGIVIGCAIAVVVSLMLSPSGPDARAAPEADPVGAPAVDAAPEESGGPRSSNLPRLSSDTEPARPRVTHD